MNQGGNAGNRGIAGLEICSENKIRESIIRNLFKNTVAVAVLCLYIKDAFTEFCRLIFKKNVSEGILEKIDKKSLSHLAILAIKGVEGVELIESV